MAEDKTQRGACDEGDIRTHLTVLKSGICKSPEFDLKGLAEYSVNAGLKCGHDCLYCSTGTMTRMHKDFVAAGENPFGFGFAITDQTTPERVAEDAKRIKLSNRDVVQLSTTVDAWAPEAKKYEIGRRCLEAILAEPGWKVRILTKNAAVMGEYDLIEKHRDRVLVGLSLTATPAKEDRMRVVEPRASSNSERLAALHEAHRRGLRTYAMFCPLLPTIADGKDGIEELVTQALGFGAEEFFVEPVNGRGPGLRLTAEALRGAGFLVEADAVDRIRNQKEWSAYARRLLVNAQKVLRAHGKLDKLRFLLYRGSLTAEDLAFVLAHSEGVRLLGKERNDKRSAGRSPNEKR
jgi:DNA repair photolyase